MIYHLLTIQKFNYNGFIIDTHEYFEVIDNIHKLNPILFHNKLINLDIQSFNNTIYYEDTSICINELDDKEFIYVYKNKELYEKLQLDLKFDFHKLPLNDINLLKHHSMTIFKGDISTKLKTAYHNYNLIGVIKGETTFYLFNPKHNSDITNKENKQIKKWAHKKIIKQNQLLFIPPHWKYFQELNNKVIQIHIDIDNIFTFIPNFFKDYQ
tara:strand:+ start:745 stop:1377 length:633 start_codon:yes stop_codon:yes gene_type:complete